MLNRATSGRTGSESRKTWSDPQSRERVPEPLAHRDAGTVILLIEDDDNMADAITHVLEREHYTVFRSRDAQDGLTQLRAGLAPDVILLDLMMPRMDGWEFRIEQRRDPMLATIPIIALSADDSAKARALDAHAFLKKPVDAQVLLDTLQSTRRELARRCSAEHAAQQKRLSSLAVIAAGIAHEINNPLAAVIGNLELAARRCTELAQELAPHGAALSRVLELIAEAQAGHARIAEVVRNVATFARPDSQEIAPLDVESVLESSIRLVANEIRHRARIERDYVPVPKVLGNAAKLGQVFLGLLIRAIHAIGEGTSSGVIRVSLTNQADAVVITVSDTGSSSLADTKSSALALDLSDPALSTGPRPLGMGPGLVLSQRSIISMGGTLRMVSEAAWGNVFRISLPAHFPATIEARASDPSPPPFPSRLRVLVVDDEEMMCKMLEATLADTFEIEACLDARLALERLLKEEFDVVLCDLMMPHLSGIELFRELERKRPWVVDRILFMTGGTFTESAEVFLEKAAPHHIRKPFRIENLVREIESVFDFAERASRHHSN